MIYIALLSIVFVLSVVLTRLIMSYAITNLLDVPNQRSSHQTPTPRGGGLAIVISYFAFLSVLYLLGDLSHINTLILLSSIAIAAIGFWDDHHPLAARWRFLTHICAAAFALYFMQGFPTFKLGFFSIDFGLMGYIVGLLFLVWFLNLFNFMDGIDGIAASELSFVAFALFTFMAQYNFSLALIALGLSISSLGFLVWNWPPAKIFMGDVGSGFLGYILGLLILIYTHQEPIFLILGLILFAVFITDATYTLLFRFVDKQQWYAAHCSHAYQNLAKQKGHSFVLAVLWVINLLWLLPISIMVFFQPEYALAGLMGAYLPLLYGAFRLNAGNKVG